MAQEASRIATPSNSTSMYVVRFRRSILYVETLSCDMWWFSSQILGGRLPSECQSQPSVRSIEYKWNQYETCNILCNGIKGSSVTACR